MTSVRSPPGATPGDVRGFNRCYFFFIFIFSFTPVVPEKNLIRIFLRVFDFSTFLNLFSTPARPQRRTSSEHGQDVGGHGVRSAEIRARVSPEWTCLLRSCSIASVLTGVVTKAGQSFEGRVCVCASPLGPQAGGRLHPLDSSKCSEKGCDPFGVKCLHSIKNTRGCSLLYCL